MARYLLNGRAQVDPDRLYKPKPNCIWLDVQMIFGTKNEIGEADRRAGLKYERVS